MTTAQQDPAEPSDALAGEDDASVEARVEAITARGPAGAFAVAGTATAIVVLIYFVFYFVAYLPRGAVQ